MFGVSRAWNGTDETVYECRHNQNSSNCYKGAEYFLILDTLSG
jgi:hypothetical protein